MKQLQTKGVILSRTDYGEADRIITVLTPDQGKLRLMARGVRKPKSKLAGGIELFSVSDITFIRGRGEIGTLISSRLIKHYGTIVKQINRVQLGYDLIKLLNKNTEDEPDEQYFYLLEQAFAALDNPDIDTVLIRAWFSARLLRHAGHAPNLETTAKGEKLTADQNYDFDFDSMSLSPHPAGRLSADEIKFLRLLFSGNGVETLSRVQNAAGLTKSAEPVIGTMLQLHAR